MLTEYAHHQPLGFSLGRLEIRFLGREAPPDRRQALRSQTGLDLDISYLRQAHSNRVLEGIPGLSGEADGLWTSRPALVLAIATADCVPLVIADQHRLALVHAGWRGIASDITSEAVRALGEASSLSAWIGPAIRRCCYEVGEDVASELVAGSDRAIVRRSDEGRPHVDLVTAARIQLRRAGVEKIADCSPCTRCHHREFWSYRHAGSEAGRNHTFAWLNGDDAEFS